MSSKKDNDELFNDFFNQQSKFIEDDDEDDYDLVEIGMGYGGDNSKGRNSSNSSKYPASPTIVPSRSRSAGAKNMYSRPTNSRQPIEDQLLTVNHKSPTYERELQRTIKQIFKSHATKGVAVIFILHISQKRNAGDEFRKSELDAEDKLLMLQRVREVLRQSIFREAEIENRNGNDTFELVKFDDHRVFAFASDPDTAMKWMVRIESAVNKLETSKATVKVSSGCGYGNIFELRNDYFGNPVNLASKLAEDIAIPGQLLVSIGDDENVASRYVDNFKLATFTPRRKQISGVNIKYYEMDSIIGDIEVVADCTCCGGNQRNIQQQQSFSPRSTVSNVIAKRDKFILVQSDLSGFTRLTKKYNVLHYLNLILHCRRIFKEVRETMYKTGICDLYKFEGDNIICKFEYTKDAIKFVTLVNALIQRYNDGKHRDYQINIKFSLAKGKVLMTKDKDIVGKAWDQCCILAEDKAEIGEILVTEAIKTDAYEDIRHEGYEFHARRGNRSVPDHYNLVYLY